MNKFWIALFGHEEEDGDCKKLCVMRYSLYSL